jgi:hypothetical protein
MIKNPNDIVDELVSDYLNVHGDSLISAVMYGSAVSHDYRPGKSDINIILVLADNSIETLNKSVHIQKKWNRKGVAVPYFMTRKYITSSLDTYPVEFLDMQTGYRVLYGDDILSDLKIERTHLRLQVERELKGVTLRLRSAYAEVAGNAGDMRLLLDASMRALLPLFKALLVMHQKKIPNVKSEIVAAVEDIYGLGLSVFSTVFTLKKSNHRQYADIFDRFVKQIDMLIDAVDAHQGTTGGTT